MKIAFLSFYSGDVARGVETFVHELANRLAGYGNKVTVFQHGGKLPNSNYQTVTIKTQVDWTKHDSYLPFLRYFSMRIKYFSKKVLENIDADTDIVFPTNGQWQSFMCSLWAKRNHKKIVISGQSGPGFDDRINLLFFPDAFTALSEYQKEWAKGANPFVNVVKISNGVDLQKFSNNMQIDFHLPGPIILNVAALVDWKRQSLAIRAVAELSKGSLVLVGKGRDEKRLTDLGNKLLPGRFKVMGFEYKDMPKVYAGAGIFTFPTVPWESFGIAMVEAMASGLPVVATDDPIRREIVGDAGLLVDPTDADKYAAALQKALETKWGDKPRKQAEKFSWDNIAEEYEKLFKTLKK